MKNDYIFIESVIFNEGEGTGAILTALKIIDHLLWGEKKTTSGKLLSFTFWLTTFQKVYTIVSDPKNLQNVRFF